VTVPDGLSAFFEVPATWKTNKIGSPRKPVNEEVLSLWGAKGLGSGEMVVAGCIGACAADQQDLVVKFETRQMR
jgi:hypothetical protein